MLSSSYSAKLTKALSVNSQSPEYAIVKTTGSEPTGDGVWPAGDPGILCPNRICLVPYCEGAAGAQFTLRLYYWNCLGNDPQIWVWQAMLLMELLCVAGDYPGPSARDGEMSRRLILDTERFCSVAAAVQGSYGDGGDTLPGSVTPAAVWVELKGARKFQFDFQQIDQQIGMNCLWAPA